jgi:hypothetical protein
MFHRGPDNEGYFDRSLVFGFVACPPLICLAATSLCPTPMSSLVGLNGETDI